MTNAIPYASQWVDSTRASHARVAYRPLAGFAKIAELEHVRGAHAWRAVTLVLVAPDGQHVLVRSQGGVDVLDPSGRLVSSVPQTVGIGTTLATSAGFFHGFDWYEWSGRSGQMSLEVPAGDPTRIWATRLEDGVARFVNQEPRLGNHGNYQEPRVSFTVEHTAAAPLARRIIGGDLLPSTWGMGAIGEDGRAVLLTLDSAMRVYGTDVVSLYKLRQLADARLAFVPYDVSIVGDRVAALEAIGVPARDETEKDLGPYQAFFDVFTVLARMPARFTTTLHLVGFDGVEQAKVTVPFAVVQPPIDGGGGVVYLVGTGLAAVRGGQVQWSQPSATPMLATAFAGGELALVSGRALRIVGVDGAVKQSFDTGADPIVAPPAIAPDGSVWVATASALYVAR